MAEEHKDNIPQGNEGSAKQPEQTRAAKQASTDQEDAMLSMMEGREVGEEGSESQNFDEQLSQLPQEQSPAASSINYDEPVVRKADFQQLSEENEHVDPRSIDMLLDVNLPISIELGRTNMSIADILALGPGSVVELNKLAGEPVEVKVNQKTVALGEVVVVDENFGVRVTQLMSRAERLKTLGA